MIDLNPQNEYYRRRAAGVEEKYHRPERLEDHGYLKDLIRTTFSRRTVLEPACGAGYWTAVMADTARQVDAFDLHPEMVDIARERLAGIGYVRLWAADLWEQLRKPGTYDGLCGGFIWSHLPRQRIPEWIDGCLRQVTPGGRLVFFDNRFVPGDSTPIADRDPEGNTWQIRQLEDGEPFPVLKNYPSREEIGTWLSGTSRPWTWEERTWFWILTIGPEPVRS